MQSTFYVLDEPKPLEAPTTSENAPSSDVSAHFALACRLASDLFRSGQRVFIFTESQQHAHLIDEHLWAFDVDAFVPHNLAGEGPANGAPVEISWLQPNNRRAVLINLATMTPDFIHQFRQVIDFVPSDDIAKQAARERYKHYRQAGFQMNTTQAPTV
ncbi:MAG: DNA polymerase-3 subunit chi [Phenylobacterium sp.]|jgi:DNA polymerase-3 subunit chi